MNNCSICGYPIMPAGIPYGYAGPVCPGSHMVTLQQPYYYGQYHFTPIPLTADDVRRIIREELDRRAVNGNG